MKKYAILVVVVVIALIALLVGVLRMAPNPLGTYVAKNNVNTTDSLFIKEGGQYHRSIYQKEGQCLFQNDGQWEYKDGRLVFTNFFPNDDAPLKEGYNFNSVLMTYSYPLEKSYGREVFGFDEITARYMFYKLW